MEKLSQTEFNELMQSAFKTKDIYPSMDMEGVATLACTPHQGRSDYDDIKFQVVYNLVNATR